MPTDTEFVATHIWFQPSANLEVLVQRIEEPNVWPYYIDKDGKKYRAGRGRKVVSLDDNAQKIKEEKAEHRKQDQEEWAAKVKREKTTGPLSFNLTVAEAVLKAVTWPSPDSPIGYASTIDGDEAVIDRRDEDGTPIVRVFIGRTQETFFIRPPKTITLEGV